MEEQKCVSLQNSKYSSVPNKNADPNKGAGWNFEKKMNKRADINKLEG